jgi:hypothetical protein
MEWFLTLGVGLAAKLASYCSMAFLSITTFSVTLAIITIVVTYCIAKEGMPDNCSSEDLGGMTVVALIGSALIPIIIPNGILLLAALIIVALPLTIFVSLAAAVGYAACHRNKVIDLCKKYYKELQ